MRKSLFYVFLLACLAGCAKPAASNTAAEELARVGGQTITQQEMDEKTLLLSEDDKDFVKTPIGRRNFIQILVREKLVQQAAKSAGLDKTDVYLTAMEEKRRELEAACHAASAALLENAWYDQLEQSGATAVSEDEIQDYYNQYPYEMKVKQILLNNAQTADEVLRTLKNSPSRWKEMTRQYSVAPQTTRDDAFAFMPGEFLPEIEVIAANSSTGSVQGFIKTAQGFHIIMKTGEKRLSFKEAKPRIEQILKDKKTDAILNNLKDKYEVVIYDKNE